MRNQRNVRPWDRQRTGLKETIPPTTGDFAVERHPINLSDNRPNFVNLPWFETDPGVSRRYFQVAVANLRTLETGAVVRVGH